jgi:threonine/homoserine/homoserine lactone efflux protein
MFDSARFFLFLTAAVLLAIAPGPGMLYVLARSLAGGKREGVLSAFGTFLGGMVHVLAAALGVSIILAKSVVAFATVKYVGAAYLCYLGVRMILDAKKADVRKGNVKKGDAHGDAQRNYVQKDEAQNDPGAFDGTLIAARPARNPLWQGVATEVLNPKTALFFLSFIPQFVDRHSSHVFLQFVGLGTMSVMMNTSADLIVIALAGPLGEKIRSSATFRRRQRTVTGAIMIGLGTYLATSESK